MTFRESEVYKLHELVVRLDGYAQRMLLAPMGLTYPEFLVLMAIGEGKPAPHQEVAGRIGASKSLVSQRVKALEKKRLVRQGVNPENRREHFLAATARGEEVLSRAYEALLGAVQEVFAPLGRERAVLGRMLDQMLAAMDALEECPPAEKAPPRKPATTPPRRATPRGEGRR